MRSLQITTAAGIIICLFAGMTMGQDQETQEVTNRTMRPVVRGQHFAFTQVLQTEGGRPMTIQLFAASTKAVSWPLRGLMVGGAFLALWAMVAVLSRLTLRVNKARTSV